jgi:hypothetical protein
MLPEVAVIGPVFAIDELFISMSPVEAVREPDPE